MTDADDYTATWSDRFVRRALVEPDQLLANPNNWRIHPPEQEAALEASLDRVGWVGDVIAQAGTDLIVDGHERVLLAISRGELVPVAWYDLSAEECDYVLATRDAIGALAVTDKSKLATLMDSLQAPDSITAQMLDNLVSGTGIATPSSSQQVQERSPEPDAPLPTERTVQIVCSLDALMTIGETLDEWQHLPGVRRIAVT